MNFRTSLREDAPEINLIPLIDVLLVILIFLAASTSFTRYAQLAIALPQAHSRAPIPPQTLTLAISHDGQYALESQWLPARHLDALTYALQTATQQYETPALIIYADAKSTHDSVILALQAAQLAGISRISFATQQAP